MGLCKCPQRQVTNQFCFEHRVNVCEHCLVQNHPKCIVQSYLQWLKDSDYISQCTLCYKDLEEQECVRLVCYHIFHWNCLNMRQSQLPANTAPAGHQCPVCEREIFPATNLVSPVAEALKEQLSSTDWGRNGLGLPLLQGNSSNKSTTSGIINSKANITTSTASTNSISKIHHNHNENSKVNGDFPYTNLKHDSPHSVLLIDAFTPPSSIDKYTSSRRSLMPLRENPIGGTDRDDNKYARRTLAEMFSRWSRRFYAPSSRPPWRRTWFLIIVGLIAFLIFIYIMAIVGRSDTQSSLDDGWGNPNPQPMMDNSHYD